MATYPTFPCGCWIAETATCRCGERACPPDHVDHERVCVVHHDDVDPVGGGIDITDLLADVERALREEEART